MHRRRPGDCGDMGSSMNVISVKGEIVIKDEKRILSVSQLLKKFNEKTPDHEVLFDGYKRMSYGELWNQSLNLANGLRKLGIKRGEKVAVCLPNWNEFVVVYMASAHLGAVLVPFNTRYRTDEVEYILKDSEAKIVFFTEEFSGINHHDQFTTAIKEANSLEILISVRSNLVGIQSYEKLLEDNENTLFEPVVLDAERDIFSILYTSGSTGPPKGAMLTHNNVVSTGTITADKMECTAADVFYIAVPLFHVFGLVPSILSAVAVGARMVLADKYNAKASLEMMESEKVTVKHGVPTMFILELNHDEFFKYDLSSLRTGIIAAAPCPVEIVKRIRKEMGCEIMVAYGLSETSPTLTMTSFDDDDITRAETVGKVLPGAEVKIVDENRQERSVGEIGEIACRSFGVMKGYYNMPMETAAAIDEEGWFYTGDVGVLDNQGNLKIVGRQRELIIRGGFNIYPREIEEVFYTHADVMEVAVIGLPDTVLGEVVCACIKLKPNAHANEQDLLNFIEQKIADYKVPDKLILLTEFPMTASGKIQKIVLEENIKNLMIGELR